jgi:hypothetical protein
MMDEEPGGSAPTAVQRFSRGVALVIWLPCLGIWKFLVLLGRILSAKRLWKLLGYGGAILGLIVVAQLVPVFYNWMALRSEARSIGEHSFGRSVFELRTQLETVAVHRGFPGDAEDLDPFEIQFDRLEDGQEYCRIQIRKVRSLKLAGICKWRLHLSTRLSCQVVPVEFKRKSLWERLGME